MGRDSRSPVYRSHKSSARDRSPVKKRRSRSRSASRDRNRRRSQERRNNLKYSRREVKEEVHSDNESPREERSSFDLRKYEKRRNEDRNKDRKRSRSRDRHYNKDENQRRRPRSRSNERRQNDQGKQYGLERKIKQEEKEPERWGKPQEPKTEEPEQVKEKKKVDLGVSGLLTEDTNTFNGVVIKYNEPPEAKKPNARWRLYPFKGEESLQVLYIHRQSAYLIGRDHKIADIPVDHPSCSKQHAVLQYRSMPFTRDDGTRARRIVPYIIDLGSANGTFLNEQKIEAQRYVEIQDKDMLKFGFSSREYVVMKERDISEAELDGAAGDNEQTTP